MGESSLLSVCVCVCGCVCVCACVCVCVSVVSCGAGSPCLRALEGVGGREGGGG